MSAVYVCGLGAVSPAGWTLASLRDALQKSEPLPVQSLATPGRVKPLQVRPVPALMPRPAFLAHPRLRRSSPITHYAAAAALEAMAWTAQTRGGDGSSPRPGENSGGGDKLSPPLKARRVGLIICLQSGCVQYSCRFFEEVLKDASTASPLIFPETVFAALGSHLGALLGNAPLATTLVGDPACFAQGVALAADWLEENRVDACLVIGAEENHWLLGEALHQFEPAAIFSSGAGALCLTLDPALSLGVRLSAITDAQTFSTAVNRTRAAQAMRAQLPVGNGAELLCDGLSDSLRANAPEQAAWRDWSGPRLSPKRVLGEGLMAGTAWQCVAGCDAVANGRFPAVNVSLVGSNQQALGVRFER